VQPQFDDIYKLIIYNDLKNVQNATQFKNIFCIIILSKNDKINIICSYFKYLSATNNSVINDIVDFFSQIILVIEQDKSEYDSKTDIGIDC